MLPNGDDRTKGDKEKNNTSDPFFGDLDVTDLPASVFACDVPVDVFTDSLLKNEFESMFSPFEATNFVYLRNFRRVRIYFETSLRAAQARIALHECIFKDQVIKIYFSQVKTDTSEESSDSLVPPQAERCFLISPPASPPVGWEPVVEAEPVINYHLLSALASLEPGESHEIHPGTQSTPSVVLHTCGEDSAPATQPKLKIQQTRRPDLP